MWTHYLVGALAMAVLTSVWLGVQVAWRHAFPAASTDPDALAGRTGCGTCERAADCTADCERAGPADRPQEETS
jgi:hypothetical protein